MKEDYSHVFNVDMINDRICIIMEELITYLLPSVKQLVVTKNGERINVSFDGNTCTREEMQTVLDKIELFQSDKSNFDIAGGLKCKLDEIKWLEPQKQAYDGSELNSIRMDGWELQ